jgi:hypothetical protein
MTLARVLTAFGSLTQVFFRGAILGAARGIEEAKMGAFCLIFGPPLDQPGALAPEGDDAIGVHEKDRVIANVLGEGGEGARRDTRRRDSRVTATPRFPSGQTLALTLLAATPGDLALAILRGEGTLMPGWRL